MKHLVLTIAIVFAFSVGVSRHAVAAYSNSGPDFSGVWNARISEASDLTSLKISYQNPKLKISRTSRSSTPVIVLGQLIPSTLSADFSYYVDGRGETNRALFGPGPITSGEVKSRTELVGQNFQISSSFQSSLGKTDISYSLEVSADGGKLNLTTTIIRDAVKQEFQESYERTEGKKSGDINGRWVKNPPSRIVSLIITHHDPEIKVTRRELSQGQEHIENHVYYTDGRGESNVQDGKPVQSVTKWDGNSLVVSISSLTRFGQDNINSWRTLRWQMSNDGKSLVEIDKQTIKTMVNMVAPGTHETKLVFARSSSQLPGQ